MRKFAPIVGLGMSALVASLALAQQGEKKEKKDDGPGMTFNQKVGSLFGLIDHGANAPPPPTPPGMPRMGSGPVSVPSGMQNGNARGLAAQPNVPQSRSSFSGNAATSGGSSLQPPQPQRMADGSASNRAPATVAARPQATNTSTTRSSIVGASKSSVGTSPSAANYKANSSSAGSGGYASNSPSAAPSANGGSTSNSGSSSVVSSRRRVLPPLNGGDQSAAPITTPTPVAKSSDDSAVPPPVPMVTAESSQSKTAADSAAEESFQPAVPKFEAEPVARPSASVASSNQPAALPQAIPTAPAPVAANSPTESSKAAGPSRSTTPTATGSNDYRPVVLASHTSPEVSVETVGPRQIIIGRESTYRVVIHNRGSTAVQSVVVQVQVPEHADVAGLVATAGHSTSAEELARSAPLEWHLESIPARSQEELTLTVVPRRSEAFELAVKWTVASPAARALVEVQEPKLALAVAGPSEVTYGQQRLFKLTVSNPGTGTAENVVLYLMPLSAGDGEPISHTVGDLKAGETNVVEVELTARQAGQLNIRTSATAAGGLKAEAAAAVAVRRAALDVVAAAPRLLFAGVPGSYEIHVRNTGDDTARQVRVTVDLPTGAKLLGSTPSASEDNTGRLVWTFDHIAPGGEQVCNIRCSWNQVGKQELAVTATAEGDVRKTAVAATEVQAVADLALDVIDTPGPIAVGQPVPYEIHVKNRGLKAAEGVEIVAYFSEGIEPEKAEGQMFDLHPGMVVFRSLPIVGPGQEKVLKVFARAQAAGQHRLRVELRSTSPATQLSHEDATFFYTDDAPATLEASAASPIRPTAATLPQGPAPARTNGLR